MFYNDPAHHKPFEIFRHNMFWTWPKRIKMWTVASTLNRTKNYCFRLLSLIAENNATQNLEYQTNSQPTGNKNELVSTVKKKSRAQIRDPRTEKMACADQAIRGGRWIPDSNEAILLFWNGLKWGVENEYFLVWRRWFAKRPIGEFKREKMEKANPTRYFKLSARWDWISDIEHFAATRNRFTYWFTGILRGDSMILTFHVLPPAKEQDLCDIHSL